MPPPVAAEPVPVPSTAPATDPAPNLPPPPPREFRAAWVATVANIDWPSKPGLPAEVQRNEALALMDRARAINLNALILQVRSAGDALYPSLLEPWSEVLSGEQGRAPWLAGEAPWDPLAFWVEQAHRRGLELHAWFNPYRARHSAARSALAPLHLAVRQPMLVKRYGDQLWMDPGEPAAAAHTLAVVADVLRRYDVDAVHIDDYFYPYPVTVPAVNGVEQPFPDEEAWARYQLGGGGLARDDWRRSNVDALVQALHRTVHEIKPGVRFGISPFGLPRPERRPPGITGFSQYDKLYADAERWLENGWLDYWAPQLYWPINREGQQFPVLLDYWAAHNPMQRHLWPGLFSSQVRAAVNPWPVREVLDQVAVLRSRQGPILRTDARTDVRTDPRTDAPTSAGPTGHIHFSLVALQQDREGLARLLLAGAYAQPALVPATPWLAAPTVAAPLLQAAGARVRIEPAAGPPAWLWAVWRRVAGAWQFSVLAPQVRVLESAEAVAVQAVDRLGRLSEQAIIRQP